MASTLTHEFANRSRPEEVGALALRHGLERTRYGVLGRDPFGRGDLLEVAYAGPAEGVVAFVEALANGGIRVGLAFADDEAEHALLLERLAGLAEVVGPDPIF
ncbi:MAG: hypothetical protein M3Q49_19715 [Actinomycetota bacterium]|nr:hypothetical protein [Actinomycetota bacterium]